MRGKSRFWIVACCILEVIYGLAFISMGVVGSYLWPQSLSSVSAQANALSVSQLTRSSINQPSPAVGRQQEPIFVQKQRADTGIWLAIFYTLTGFFGVIAGQEKDRIFPLLHTTMALVCIIWTPLLWEILYLLVRPTSNFAYSFLNEMDLISSQRHWAAYICSICCVVAGSFLYLLSAALTAYQYGIRMIDRKAAGKLKEPASKNVSVSNNANSAPVTSVNANTNNRQKSGDSTQTGAIPSNKRSIKNNLRGSPIFGQHEATTGNGSLNVDMDDQAGSMVQLDETTYHHHSRRQASQGASVMQLQQHPSSGPYLTQSQSRRDPDAIYAQVNRSGGAGGQSGNDRDTSRSFDRRDHMTSNRPAGHGGGLAFSQYYDDAQEAIV